MFISVRTVVESCYFVLSEPKNGFRMGQLQEVAVAMLLLTTAPVANDAILVLGWVCSVFVVVHPPSSITGNLHSSGEADACSLYSPLYPYAYT